MCAGDVCVCVCGADKMCVFVVERYECACFQACVVAHTHCELVETKGLYVHMYITGIRNEDTR